LIYDERPLKNGGSLPSWLVTEGIASPPPAGFERFSVTGMQDMPDDTKNLPQPPRPRPPGWRDDIIVVPMNQPIPPGPGIKWWLQHIVDRNRGRK
jgi:hypothetical protein